MRMLNSKSTLDCEENEINNHYEEMEQILNKITKVEDFDCALICKYQDAYHKKYNQKIYGCKFSELFDELERFDIKNGVDLYIDDDGYIVFLIYGQGYTWNDNFHLITMGVKVLPYNKYREFIDISDIVFEKSNKCKVSKQQFDN